MRQIHTLSVLFVAGVTGVALAQGAAERHHGRSRTDARSGVATSAKQRSNSSPRGLERACEGGDALACRKLGSLYENGEEVAKDEARAARYFQRACDGDNALGCFRLGLMYDLGHGGLKQSKVRALKLYEKACDGGEKFGCFNLGYAFENGNGVPKDLARATKFYRRSCDLGNSDGCDKVKGKLRTTGKRDEKASGHGSDKDGGGAAQGHKGSGDRHKGGGEHRR